MSKLTRGAVRVGPDELRAVLVILATGEVVEAALLGAVRLTVSGRTAPVYRAAGAAPAAVAGRVRELAADANAPAAAGA